MAYDSRDILGPATNNKLDELTRQPGDETIRAPVNPQGQIQIGIFSPDHATLRWFKVNILPGTIHAQLADGEPFGIVDYLTSSDGAEQQALKQPVTGITLVRSEHGWEVQQDPDQPVKIANFESFSLFWETVAKHARKAREKNAQANQSTPDS